MTVGPARLRRGDNNVEFHAVLVRACIVVHARGHCRPEGESVSSPAGWSIWDPFAPRPGLPTATPSTVCKLVDVAIRIGRLFCDSVTPLELLQEVCGRDKVACLEAFRKLVEDRFEKLERFVSLAAIRPDSCETYASTQL
jgi:hypothetical protein